MKRLFTTSLTLAAGLFSLFATADTQQTTAAPQLSQQAHSDKAPMSGMELIQQAQNALSESAGRKFLKRAEEQYQKNKQSFAYNTLLETRSELAKAAQESALVPKPVAQKTFEKQSDDAAKRRDERLAELITKNPDNPLAQSLKKVVFNEFDEAQKAALNYYYDLRTKFYGEGATPLENTLIDIDMACWLKQRDLDTAFVQGKLGESTYEKQTLMLELDKLEQMKKASLSNPDSKEGHAILVVYGIYPTQAAINYDRKMLVTLGEGRITPHTAFEKDVQRIAKDFLDEMKGVIAQHFQENSEQ